MTISCTIGHCTVVCSVPWPLIRSEAGGDLVLLQTFPRFMCKSWYSHANKPVNMIIYIWKTRRFETKQGHRHPHFYFKKGQSTEHTTVKWPIFLLRIIICSSKLQLKLYYTIYSMNSSYLLQIQNYPTFYHKITNPSYIYIYTITQMCGFYINVITFKSKPTHFGALSGQ